jgi:transposase
MPTSKFIQHDTIQSLNKKLKEKQYSDIRDRIRALIMISKKYSYWEIADNLGFSLQWVKNLAMDYTAGGLEALARKPHKGSEGFLSPDQLIEFYEIILNGPCEGELLSRYRICDLREIVKNKWGIDYSVGGMHALLKRMKLSHVTTRPQNPKNDPVVMELWKKKPKVLLSKKRKNIGALKSGSKTKPDMAKKESATDFGQLKV